MRRSTTNGITQLVYGNNGTTAAALFFFLLGISAGVFTALMMNAGEKEQIIGYLDQYLLITDANTASFPALFLHSAGNNLGLLLLIMLSGITVIAFPVALAALTYKGMALGFSSALLLESLSSKGIAVILTSMVPQNVILLPVLFLAAIAALNVAFSTISNRHSAGTKKSLTMHAGSYFTLAIILAALILAGSLIEALICPLLTRLII